MIIFGKMLPSDLPFYCFVVVFPDCFCKQTHGKLFIFSFKIYISAL
jgi:hypothetical protein